MAGCKFALCNFVEWEESEFQRRDYISRR
jgi:hypothetical protein